MKIDITSTPQKDIFCDRKKYALWFSFFLLWAFIGIAIGIFAVYFDTHHYANLDDIALGALVVSSLGVTWFGNRLQAYKKLFPPQLDKLTELRKNHPVIEGYCKEVEAADRRLIRAEYEAFLEYSENHSAVPFT